MVATGPLNAAMMDRNSWNWERSLPAVRRLYSSKGLDGLADQNQEFRNRYLWNEFLLQAGQAAPEVLVIVLVVIEGMQLQALHEQAQRPYVRRVPVLVLSSEESA